MDYKKKYEEALERMKSWAKGEHPECFSEAQKAAEFIFPELKRNEDEWIVSKLIELFNDMRHDDSILHDYELDKEKTIAWLEKQKDHEAELDKAYKTADEVMYRRGYEDAKRELEKQGEQEDTCNGCDNVKGCVTCTNGDQWAHYSEASTVELSDDENPTHSEVTKTWSEEDEKAFEGVIGFLHLYGQFESSKFVDTLKKRIKGE